MARFPGDASGSAPEQHRRKRRRHRRPRSGPEGGGAPGPAAARPARGPNRLGLALLVVALGALGFTTVLIFRQFFAPLLLALVFTSVSYPLYRTFERWTGPQRASLASGLTCAALVLLVGLPLVWIGGSLASQVPRVRERVLSRAAGVVARFEASTWRARAESVFGRERTGDVVRSLKALLGAGREESAPAESPSAESGPEDGAGGARDRAVPEPRRGDWTGLARWLTAAATRLLGGLLGLLVKLAVMLFLMFYFFRDGARLLRSIQRALPIEEAHQRRIVETFRQASQSLLRGTLLTALVQGTVAACAFWIVGLPALVGGAAVAIAALVPVAGTALVTVPVLIWLLSDGRWWEGGFIALVAAAIASLDNLLRPFLLRGGLALHPVWIFISLLGGISCFGPLGIVLGPMTVVLLGTLLGLVREESREQSRSPPEPGLPRPG